MKGRRSDTGVITGLRDGDLLLYAKGVTNDDHYMAIMKEGHVMLDVAEIPEQYKLNKGVKVIPVKRGDMIIKLQKVKTN